MLLGKYYARSTTTYRKGVCPAQAGPLADFSSGGTACRWIRAFQGKPCRYAPTATARRWRLSSKVRLTRRIFETIPESLKWRYWRKAGAWRTRSPTRRTGALLMAQGLLSRSGHSKSWDARFLLEQFHPGRLTVFNCSRFQSRPCSRKPWG